MSVKFVTDSASDILPQEAQALGISLIPLKVVFGEETYEDGATLSHEEFFRKLTSGNVLPTTCQAAPATFAECFEKLTANGDTVVTITLSSKLSGTYQSAMIAAADFPGQVYVVDGLNATIGQRILLQRGLQLAEQNLSAADIAGILEEEKHNIRLFAIVDTLEYLNKGGRISAATAIAGTLLSIKPAISVREGEVVMAGKARGIKQGNAMIRHLVEDQGGINYDKPIALVYSGLDDSLLRQFIDDSPELWNGKTDLPCHSLGCAIGTHVGPGAYGVAFFIR
ncbi:MAG: DegV family protein [Faecousia sp.]